MLTVMMIVPLPAMHPSLSALMSFALQSYSAAELELPELPEDEPEPALPLLPLLDPPEPLLLDDEDDELEELPPLEELLPIVPDELEAEDALLWLLPELPLESELSLEPDEEESLHSVCSSMPSGQT